MNSAIIQPVIVTEDVEDDFIEVSTISTLNNTPTKNTLKVVQPGIVTVDRGIITNSDNDFVTVYWLVT